MTSNIKAGTPLKLSLDFKGAHGKFSVADFRLPKGNPQGQWTRTDLETNQLVLLGNPDPLSIAPVADGEQAAIVVAARLTLAAETGKVELDGEVDTNAGTDVANGTDSDSISSGEYLKLGFRLDLVGT
jgi:hypothetical protein